MATKEKVQAKTTSPDNFTSRSHTIKETINLQDLTEIQGHTFLQGPIIQEIEDVNEQAIQATDLHTTSSRSTLISSKVDKPQKYEEELQISEKLQGIPPTKEIDSVKETGVKQPNSQISTKTPRSTLNEADQIQDQKEDEVILHITETEDREFPDELNNLIDQIIPIDNEIYETRWIYLNNNWQITGSIGNPDFVGLIENNSNIDLLSYISENYLINLN